jgi:endothelin-converting enzyme/putative endopeptidase
MNFSWFDDSGSQCRRKFSRWWTAEDSKQFSALTTALATQYSALEPLPGTLLMVNLLGRKHWWFRRNKCRLWWITVVFKRKWKPGLIDGYTPEQRLCLGTIWRSKARDEATKNQVKQIHILQECTVLMYHCKMWIPLSGVRYSSKWR